MVCNKFKLRVMPQKVVDNAAVFLPIKRAGGVYQAPAGTYGVCAVRQDEPLQGCQAADFFFGQPPTDVNAPLQNAAVGAGDVEQYGVEVFEPFFRAGLGPVVPSNLNISASGSHEVVAELGEPVLMEIGGKQMQVSARSSNHRDGFASGGCAGVE